MTATTDIDPAADAALKAKHRAMWALGDYPHLATEVIADLGATLVAACDIRPGEDVVDVAAGAGNAAIPAALAGAKVVATDLTPELLAAGEAAAAARGATLRWRVSDAEAMVCDDNEHDVAISCVGVMFAPHHQRAADELLRIICPGGRVGVLSWTPAGFIGQLFAAMKPFAPPPPPGASPAPLWGDEAHVRELFGDRVTDFRAQTGLNHVTQFATGAQFRDFFKAYYGPTVAVYRSLAEDPARAAELDVVLAELGDRSIRDGAMDWEYLIVTATKR